MSTGLLLIIVAFSMMALLSLAYVPVLRRRGAQIKPIKAEHDEVLIAMRLTRKYRNDLAKMDMIDWENRCDCPEPETFQNTHVSYCERHHDNDYRCRNESRDSIGEENRKLSKQLRQLGGSVPIYGASEYSAWKYRNPQLAGSSDELRAIMRNQMIGNYLSGDHDTAWEIQRVDDEYTAYMTAVDLIGQERLRHHRRSASDSSRIR